MCHFSDVWDLMTWKDRYKVIEELADIDGEMLNFEFSAYGSLYLEGDIIEGTDSLAVNSDPCFSRYRLGPIVHRHFWKGERTSMNIDRGPCKHVTVCY